MENLCAESSYRELSLLDTLATAAVVAFRADECIFVNQADADRFDLVISDVGLPDGDGCQLMRALRDRYQLVGIAVSGYATESYVQQSSAVGFLQHLIKPVRVAALREAITRATELVQCN